MSQAKRNIISDNASVYDIVTSIYPRSKYEKIKFIIQYNQKTYNTIQFIIVHVLISKILKKNGII